MVMEKLTDCEKCKAEVYTVDIFRNLPIPNSMGHTALVYKCSECGTVDKIAATLDEWRAMQERIAEGEEEEKFNTDALMESFREDLELVDHVGHVQAIWDMSRRGPEREEVMGACKCEECKRRRGW